MVKSKRKLRESFMNLHENIPVYSNQQEGNVHKRVELNTSNIKDIFMSTSEYVKLHLLVLFSAWLWYYSLYCITCPLLPVWTGRILLQYGKLTLSLCYQPASYVTVPHPSPSLTWSSVQIQTTHQPHSQVFKMCYTSSKSCQRRTSIIM